MNKETLENYTDWEKRMRSNENFDHGCQFINRFLDEPNNPWPLYSGLKYILGHEKAQEIADLLEI